MKYTESHEWIKNNADSGIATVGVTNFAQKELGEIVYVELPQVGKEVQSGAEAAVLESTKAAADVYAPASGVVVEVNERLKAESGLINLSPEDQGWIFKIKLTNAKELDMLLTDKEYKNKTSHGLHL